MASDSHTRSPLHSSGCNHCPLTCRQPVLQLPAFLAQGRPAGAQPACIPSSHISAGFIKQAAGFPTQKNPAAWAVWQGADPSEKTLQGGYEGRGGYAATGRDYEATGYEQGQGAQAAAGYTQVSTLPHSIHTVPLQ